MPRALAWRRDLPEFRVIGTQDLPELAKVSADLAPQEPQLCKTFKAGRVRIEYVQDGVPVEEDIYCTVGYIQASYSTTVFGGLDNIIGFRAAKGHLDEQSKLLETIVFSIRLNIEWYSKYQRLVQSLQQAQLQEIQNIGQMTRQLVRTHEEIDDSMRRTYQNRVDAMEKMNEGVDKIIRGVDDYYVPSQQSKVELPAGYGHAWRNSLGEYIVTDNPNYDPNQKLQGNWEEMRKTNEER